MVRRAGLDEQAVIRAAVALVDEEGPGALSLVRLAERLSVRSPSLYKHVTGLEGVQRGIALWGLRELEGRLARSAVGKAGEAAVTALADAYRAFAKEHPGLYTLTVRAPEPTDAELVAARDAIVAVVAAVFAPYGLDRAGTIHTIRAFRALLHGFVSLEILGGFGLPLDVEASYRHLLTMFMQGLRQLPPPRSER